MNTDYLTENDIELETGDIFRRVGGRDTIVWDYQSKTFNGVSPNPLSWRLGYNSYSKWVLVLRGGYAYDGDDVVVKIGKDGEFYMPTPTQTLMTQELDVHLQKFLNWVFPTIFLSAFEAGEGKVSYSDARDKTMSDAERLIARFLLQNETADRNGY